MSTNQRASNYELTARLLDYAIIFIIVAIIALSPWPYGSVRMEAKYAIHLAALAMLFLWLVRKYISKREIDYSPAYTPLVFLIAIAFISISYSVYRYASIIEFLNLLSYGIIFFIAMEMASTRARKDLILWCIIGIGLFYCAYGIAQYYGHIPRQYWHQQNSLSSRFVNNGSFGAFANVIIFLCLGALLSRKYFISKLLCASILIIPVIALVLSNSRISWIVFILIFISFAARSFFRKGRSRARQLLYSIVFICALAGALYFFRSLIWERLHIAVLTQFQSLKQRADVWIGTVKMIITHPLGVGVGGFQYIYPSYRIHSDRFFVDFAHSDFLQTLSELGIVGFAAFVWFIARTLVTPLTRLWSGGDRFSYMNAGLCCAVFSILAQATVDFPLHIPANAVLFFASAGLLSANASEEKHRAISLTAAAGGFLIMGLIACALFFTACYFSHTYNRSGMAAVSKIDLEKALSSYGASIAFMPLNSEPRAARGAIYSLKDSLALGLKKEEYRAKAIADFKRAIRLNPYQSINYLNLAWLYAEEGRHEEVMKAFRKTIKTNPTDGVSYYPYANYCLEHNLLDEAIRTYRKGLGLFMEERAGHIFGGAYGVFEKVYEHTRDYDILRQLVPDRNIYIRLQFAAFLEGKKMAPDACREYERVLRQDPQNPEANAALKRIKKE